MLQSKPARATGLLGGALVTVLLLWSPAPAEAHEEEKPPPVENLKCVAEEDRIPFSWDIPSWSGGELKAYDAVYDPHGDSPTSYAYSDEAVETCVVPGEPRAANNPPTVASAITDATVVNESGTHEASLSGVFSDADQDSLTITATSSGDKTATMSVSTDYATLTVTAKARGVPRQLDLPVHLLGRSSLAAPVVASAIADVSELEVDATYEVSMSGVFRDADGDALTITADTSGSAVVQISTAIDPSTGSVTAVTVIAKSEGTATITVTAQDSDGNSVSDAFDVTAPAAQQQQAVELPSPAVGLDLTASAEESVTVRWQAPQSGGAPRGYIVHIKRKGGGDGDTRRPAGHPCISRYGKASGPSRCPFVD